MGQPLLTPRGNLRREQATSLFLNFVEAVQGAAVVSVADNLGITVVPDSRCPGPQNQDLGTWQGYRNRSKRGPRIGRTLRITPQSNRQIIDLRLFHSNQRFFEEALDIVKTRRGVIVVVHQTVMVFARRGAFVDDLADHFQSRASVMKCTSDIERGSLQRTINAPRRRAGRAFAVVSAVPRRFGRKNSLCFSHDLLVERVWLHFVGSVEIETQRRGQCELRDREPAVFRPQNTPVARIDLKLERSVRIPLVGHITCPNRRRVHIVTPNSSGDRRGGRKRHRRDLTEQRATRP
jgi:hypothetical protein